MGEVCGVEVISRLCKSNNSNKILQTASKASYNSSATAGELVQTLSPYGRLRREGQALDHM